MSSLFGRALALVRRARAKPLRIFLSGSGCCAERVLEALASERRIVLASAPERAQLLLVAGRISLKSAPLVLAAFRALPQPRWVVAAGSCAATGGLFDVYPVVPGAGRLVPVDIFVPGCPPDPGALRAALEEIAATTALRAPGPAGGAEGENRARGPA
ncbi:MAG: NADH-quinone oxidoreductase subunit B [Planctomycetota bacterium]